MRRANAGLTLIEMMVVMLIIALLSSIAIPAYRSYVLRANRTDAKTGLMSYADTFERCYTRDNAYNGTSCTALVTSLTTGVTVSTNDYQIAVDTAGVTQTSYALKAVPLGGQLKDTQCGTFTLDDKNTRGVTGTSSAQDCWGR